MPEPPPDPSLLPLLSRVFGHAAFRPFQEAVCRAVTEGRDALVVMPTGAGKSLCYQLPGLARGGTTLVVSPLIALMEDHVGKLKALGLLAERIHSGMDRLASRQVCRDYLDGKLDYFFIAPERLSVPGFPEMLARRKPVLIAVDEAHCISHWGHDFRPDYRLLGARLPQLRPAPVLALTATATPRVQDDIAAQLGMQKPLRFIHGFRRTNIAVEVTEATPSRRADIVREVLEDLARRPAIVYVPTRREAETLAGELGAVAYHAGLSAAQREAAQGRFLGGEVAVIVATIAFGMGIDKADVRTVIHTGLPGSVEGYYQEIGRAGRDGLPSRAILLHSYGDRRTHEFFLARDYPEPSLLDRVFRALDGVPLGADEVMAATDLVPEILERVLEKLALFGGAVLAPEGGWLRGEGRWRHPYEEQRRHRHLQLELMHRFAEGSSCRMRELVRHFGDEEDDGAPCGLCDVCAPNDGVATRLRKATPMEEAALRLVLTLLRARDGQGTGRIHRDVVAQFPAVDRRAFEDLLAGLARGGLVRVEEDSFEKNGETIRFRRATLTAEGLRRDAPLEAAIPVAALAKPKKEERKERKAKDARRLKAEGPRPEGDEPSTNAPLVEALRAWRAQEARRKKLPAYCVLPDRALLAVAAASPRTEDELLALHGMGPKRVAEYGGEILRVVGGASGSARGLPAR